MGALGLLVWYLPPFSVTLMMAQITFGGIDSEGAKRQTVHDPCVGCGVMLLAASNYCLRGYAQDVSYIAVCLTKIQLCFYAPWYAMPKYDLKGFEETSVLELPKIEELKVLEVPTLFDLLEV